MSNEFIKAADDARRLLRGFKAFEEVAQALDTAGRVTQAHAEAVDALAKLQPQLEAARQALATAQQATRAEKEQAVEVVKAAKLKAADITRAAELKADSVVSEAHARASSEVEAAAAKTRIAETTVAAALTRRAEITAECEAVEARLAKAQAQIAKLLG